MRMHRSGPLTSFHPPAIPERVFTDAEGVPIDYGNRWDSPPVWAYSTVRNIERFEPVTTHAEALITHLAATCRVEILDDLGAGNDLLFPVRTAHRAMRLTPAAPAAAPLTLVFLDDHQVAVHAGFAQDFSFPVCPCEACDEAAAPLIRQLTDLVDAVTTGRFQEFFERRRYGYRIEHAEGSDEGWSTPSQELRRRLTWSRTMQRTLGSWQAWPLR